MQAELALLKYRCLINLTPMYHFYGGESVKVGIEMLKLACTRQ